MPGKSFRIARVAGIPVGVHPLWLVIVALITASLGGSYFPDAVPGIDPGAAYGLGLLSALLLFASVLAHEFGHALVARRHGVEVVEIDLWLLGGVARMRGAPTHAGDELRYALAGPAVTLAIAIVFGAAAIALPTSAPEAVRAVVSYQALVNAAILAFNLMPAFPLDGGRVARALLWRRNGDLVVATQQAAKAGRAFGYGLVGLGALSALGGAAGGLWFVVIGDFLLLASKAEAQGTELESTFAGTTARELMATPAVCIPATQPVEQALSGHFATERFTSYPVVTPSGEVVGMVALDSVVAVPPADGTAVTVGDVMETDPRLLVGPDQDMVELVEDPGFNRFGRAVVVDEARHALGVVSVTDVRRALRVAQVTRARAAVTA